MYEEHRSPCIWPVFSYWELKGKAVSYDVAYEANDRPKRFWRARAKRIPISHEKCCFAEHRRYDPAAEKA